MIPGVPHHVTQRGVRRMPIFFDDDDRVSYLRKMSGKCTEHGLEVLCWCLMQNHVHLVVRPQSEDSLSLAVGRAHWAYVRDLNERLGWKGHLFEASFFSTPMDDAHTRNALRYVLQNPVRAGITPTPEDYRWSSARFHLGLRRTDPLVRTGGELGPGDWEALLSDGPTDLEEIRACTREGRPYGSDEFLAWVGSRSGVDFSKRRRGRPRSR